MQKQNFSAQSTLTSPLTQHTLNNLTSDINKFPEYIPSSAFDHVESNLIWSHFSVSRRIWEYIIFIASLLSPIEMSFVLLFDEHISVKAYSFFFVVDVFQIMDNFVILFTPVLHHGILISDINFILHDYGIFYYVLHVIASIPLGWVGIIRESPSLYVILSLKRLLRLHQSWRSYKMIKNSTLYNNNFARLIPYTFLIFFIAHTFACILYAFGKYIDPENSWITEFVQDGYTTDQMYAVAIYFVLTTLLTLGYGDIHPVSTPEVIATTVLAIIGVFFQSSMIANLVNALSDPMGKKFITQYRNFKDFIEFKEVPLQERNTIKHYFQGQWVRNHGAPNWDTLLSHLPKSIQNGIKLEFCQKTLAGMPLFNSVGQKYLIQIMDAMEPFTYLPNDVICTQEEPVCDLLIFNHGLIQLILNDVPLATLNVDSGYVDGERQLMFGRVQDKTIKAITFVDGWRLKRRDFLELLSSKRTLRLLMLSNAKARFPKDFLHSQEWDDNQISEEPISDSDTETSTMEIDQNFDILYVDDSSSSSSDEQFTDADL